MLALAGGEARLKLIESSRNCGAKMLCAGKNEAMGKATVGGEKVPERIPVVAVVVGEG
jgi:hypothetical protein